MLPSTEYVEAEGRYYLNPQLQVDEASEFITNLRNTQQAQNAEISQQAQNLGTDISTSLGGLTGAEGYWTSRYQTPQTNQLVQDLRTAAQASALEQALQNEQAIWKQRYQNAYKAAQRRTASRASGGGSAQLPSTTAGQGETEKKATDSDTIVEYGGSVKASEGQILTIGPDGIARGYINGEYVELKPGQAYKPSLDLTPDNPLTPQNPLTPTNEIQRKNK